MALTTSRSRGLSTLALSTLQVVFLCLNFGAAPLSGGSVLYAAGGQASEPHSLTGSEPDRAPPKSMKPEVVGVRLIYGHSSLSARDAGADPTEEELFGSAVAFEWSFLHHHLELELIGGVFQHHGLTDEFGEVVLKLPVHLTPKLDVLIGLGGVVETHHQRPELGLQSDLNLRYWTTSHWGLSAEVDYISLESGSVVVEGIAELLYRF